MRPLRARPAEDAVTDDLRRAAERVVAEFRTDLRAGKWSDVLLEAMDDLRRALDATGADDAKEGT